MLLMLFTFSPSYLRIAETSIMQFDANTIHPSRSEKVENEKKSKAMKTNN